MHGFISGLSILFHWSIFLFLCQYHSLLMAVALSEFRKVDSFQLHSSFFKTALAIQGLLCFHTNCEILCSSSVKNAIDNLTEITLSLQLHLVV